MIVKKHVVQQGRVEVLFPDGALGEVEVKVIVLVLALLNFQVGEELVLVLR